MSAYITGVGAYLPGDPIGNDEIESYLGTTDGSSRIRKRMLDANGIEKRHYAIDKSGSTVILNEEMAANAVRAALGSANRSARDVQMLATGTTQGDLAVPGFASMVHGRLGGGPMEILSAGGVCCSGVASLRAVEDAVKLKRHRLGVAVGSELVSRSLRASRFNESGFDAEFLRFMLSDGAGAVVVEDRPSITGPSLRIDWTHLVSHAHRFGVCMYAGASDPEHVEAGSTWQDQPTPAVAHESGMLNLRQDVGRLSDIVALGVEEYVGLVRDGRIEPDSIDHLLVHYSSEYFRPDIVRLMGEAGLMIPEHKWFTNLRSKGNTGAASIFVMLEEAFRLGRFSPGDRLLLMVPESGRFSVAFVHLTCVDTGETDRRDDITRPDPAVTEAEDTESPSGWLLEELALVWAQFEHQLNRVPIVQRIESYQATLDDYRSLLYNLRQQVKEGSRWITRAASNITSEYADLRAEFIDHAAEEQLDFRMLDEDYQAVGGDPRSIAEGVKNPGSEALSAFMFNQASRENPFDLLGAMYIIEGLGANKATRWVELLRDQLDLSESQTRFLTYHGGADEEHTEKMFSILRSELITLDIARSIVHTARVVARLYALQLEEVDNA